MRGRWRCCRVFRFRKSFMFTPEDARECVRSGAAFELPKERDACVQLLAFVLSDGRPMDLAGLPMAVLAHPSFTTPATFGDKVRTWRRARSQDRGESRSLVAPHRSTHLSSPPPPKYSNQSRYNRTATSTLKQKISKNIS